MDQDRVLAEARLKYGKIFSVTNDGIDFIFRPLTRGDISYLQSLSKTGSSTDVEEAVLERCIIWPINHDFDQHAAGFVPSLCDHIRECSGFDDVESFIDLIEQARNDVNKVTNLIKAMIVAAIPSMRPEEVDDLSLYKLAELLALAEKIFEFHLSEIPPRLVLQEDNNTTTGSKADPIAEKLRQAMGQ